MAGELSSKNVKRRIRLGICCGPQTATGDLSMHSQGSLKHRAPRKDGFHPEKAEKEREALTLVCD